MEHISLTSQYSVVCVSLVNLRLDSIQAESLSLHFTLEIHIDYYNDTYLQNLSHYLQT
jgi:hypothetical protein